MPARSHPGECGAFLVKHLEMLDQDTFVKDSNVISGSNQAGSTSSGLLARLRSKDRDAWSRLAKLYGPLVYGWCRRRGLRAEDAADVVQEVFRAVAGRIEDFKAGPTGSFRGWLWTITRNKILDHHRRTQRQPEGVGGLDAQHRLLQIPEALDDSEAESNTNGNLRAPRPRADSSRFDGSIVASVLACGHGGSARRRRRPRSGDLAKCGLHRQIARAVPLARGVGRIRFLTERREW